MLSAGYSAAAPLCCHHAPRWSPPAAHQQHLLSAGTGAAAHRRRAASVHRPVRAAAPLTGNANSHVSQLRSRRRQLLAAWQSRGGAGWVKRASAFAACNHARASRGRGPHREDEQRRKTKHVRKRAGICPQRRHRHAVRAPRIFLCGEARVQSSASPCQQHRAGEGSSARTTTRSTRPVRGRRVSAERPGCASARSPRDLAASCAALTFGIARRPAV